MLINLLRTSIHSIIAFNKKLLKFVLFVNKSAYFFDWYLCYQLMVKFKSQNCVNGWTLDMCILWHLNWSKTFLLSIVTRNNILIARNSGQNGNSRITSARIHWLSARQSRLSRKSEQARERIGEDQRSN